jgi:hypothetical protein
MFRLRSIATLSTALCLFGADVLLAADKPGRTEPQHPSGQAAIEKALTQAIDLEFTEAPLGDVVAHITSLCKVEVVIDVRSMNDAGIRPDSPVTVRLHGLPLRSALNVMLRQLGLEWTIQDELLLITTPEGAAAVLSTKVYDVSDLVVCRGEHDELWDDYETLSDMIQYTVSPSCWDCVGGPGTINGATLGKAKVLTIAQNYHVHRQVGELLASIRDVAARNPDGGPPRRNKPTPYPYVHTILGPGSPFNASPRTATPPPAEQSPAAAAPAGKGK